MCEHGTKTILVFLPADGKASWSLLQSSVSLLSGSTVQPENIYSCILEVTGQVCESHTHTKKLSDFLSENTPAGKIYWYPQAAHYSSMGLGLLDQLQIFWQLYLIKLLGLLTGLGLIKLQHLIYPRLLKRFSMLVLFKNISLLVDNWSYSQTV